MRGTEYLPVFQLVLTFFCRATAEELLKEYKACESADYISYVSG